MRNTSTDVGKHRETTVTHLTDGRLLCGAACPNLRMLADDSFILSLVFEVLGPWAVPLPCGLTSGCVAGIGTSPVLSQPTPSEGVRPFLAHT